MLNEFLNWPTALICSIAAIVSMAISVLALIIIRKIFDWELFQENHEVGGFLFNALGLIYAVLVAFVVYATWSDFEQAANNADYEANQIHDLYLNSDILPEQSKIQIRKKMIEYINIVINEEWKLLEEGKASNRAGEAMVEIWNLYLNMDSINTFTRQSVYNESLRRLSNLTDYRRLRILNSENKIPGVIWIVIIVGALTSVGFTLFFGAKRVFLQAIMTALFAMTNALILLLILILDNSFTGDVKITSEAFEEILINIQNLPPGM